MKLGEDVEDGAIEEKIAAQRPEQCALLIYTVRIDTLYVTFITLTYLFSD
jgi:hypothetical protein